MWGWELHIAREWLSSYKARVVFFCNRWNVCMGCRSRRRRDWQTRSSSVTTCIGVQRGTEKWERIGKSINNAIDVVIKHILVLFGHLFTYDTKALLHAWQNEWGARRKRNASSKRRRRRRDEGGGREGRNPLIFQSLADNRFKEFKIGLKKKQRWATGWLLDG